MTKKKVQGVYNVILLVWGNLSFLIVVGVKGVAVKGVATKI